MDEFSYWQLKCLYVAITRARSRLWIVDYSDACLPMKVRTLHHSSQLAIHKYETQRHLLNHGLVVEPPTVRYPLECFVGQPTKKQRWWVGMRLINHWEFVTIMAFENTGEVYMKAVAVACTQRKVVHDVPEYVTRHQWEAFVSLVSAL